MYFIKYLIVAIFCSILVACSGGNPSGPSDDDIKTSLLERLKTRFPADHGYTVEVQDFRVVDKKVTGDKAEVIVQRTMVAKEAGKESNLLSGWNGSKEKRYNFTKFESGWRLDDYDGF